MKSPRLKLLVGLTLALGWEAQSSAINTNGLFKAGVEAYAAGDYAQSVRAFRDYVAVQPATGALVNLGNAEWQRGQTGEAILAWERALWVDAFNPKARNNLQFARVTAQLEAPALTWYEVASTWLPADWWAWVVGVSVWLAIGMLTLPGILRWRKAPWQQAVAALGIGVFLLSLPAHFGVQTRARLGFVLERDVPLRLTPTSEAEAVTRLAAGEPGRRVRIRGDYVFIRTNRAMGWVERSQFKLVCGGG